MVSRRHPLPRRLRRHHSAQRLHSLHNRAGTTRTDVGDDVVGGGRQTDAVMGDVDEDGDIVECVEDDIELLVVHLVTDGGSGGSAGGSAGAGGSVGRAATSDGLFHRLRRLLDGLRLLNSGSGGGLVDDSFPHLRYCLVKLFPVLECHLRHHLHHPRHRIRLILAGFVEVGAGGGGGSRGVGVGGGDVGNTLAIVRNAHDHRFDGPKHRVRVHVRHLRIRTTQKSPDDFMVYIVWKT